MEAQRQELESVISQQAAYWVVVLEDGSGPDKRLAFSSWLRESHRHVQAFLSASSRWSSLDHIDPQHRLDVQSLLESGDSNITSITEGGRQAHPVESWARRRLDVLKAVACVAAVVILALVSWTLLSGESWQSEEIATGIGEQRAYKLADGSIVHLNTNSRVMIDYSAKSREVRLLRGEALFTVEHDAARPFRVSANRVRIQAVGTQFNVYLAHAQTTVTVLEGAVKIAQDSRANKDDATAIAVKQPAARNWGTNAGDFVLGAGQQATVTLNGEVKPLPIENVIETAAWRERRVIFKAKPLTEIAAQFNRYSTRQIRIVGREIGQRRLSGVFDVDDPELLVEFLSRDDAISIHRTKEEIVVESN